MNEDKMLRKIFEVIPIPTKDNARRRPKKKSIGKIGSILIIS